MTEKDRQEYESARQWSRHGLGVLNSGKTQAERDGHLAGLMERQADERKQAARQFEQALVEQRRKEDEMELEQIRLDRMEEECRREEEWEDALRAEEREAQEQALDELCYDTRLLGGKVAAGRANAFERDAYGFARREMTALVRRAKDRSLAYSLSTILDETPEIDLSAQSRAGAPEVLRRLGRCLYDFRQTFLDSGYVLPFDFCDPEVEVAREVTVESPLIIVTALHLNGDISVAPLWLRCDEPLLFLRRINYGSEERPYWSLELDADVHEILRRQETSSSDGVLLERMSSLWETLNSALSDGLWSVLDRWCQWRHWLQPGEVVPGAFGGVLSSPNETLRFINAHKAFLLRLETGDLQELLVDIKRPTKQVVELYQVRLQEESSLIKWVRSDELTPPLVSVMGVASGFRLFSSVNELDKSVREVCRALGSFRNEARDAWDRLPSHLISSAGCTTKSKCMQLLSAFATGLNLRSRPASMSPRTLLEEVQGKVARIRGSFLAIRGYGSPVGQAGYLFCMVMPMFSVMFWMLGDIPFLVAPVLGALASAPVFLFSYVRFRMEAVPMEALPILINRARAWRDADFS